MMGKVKMVLGIYGSAFLAVVAIASVANGVGIRPPDDALRVWDQATTRLAICPAYISANLNTDVAPTAIMVGERPVPLFVAAVTTDGTLVKATGVTWTSGNRAIATVTANAANATQGLVTGVTSGQTYIHAHSQQGNAYYCVTVLARK